MSVPAIDLISLVPEIILFVTALVVLVMDLFSSEERKTYLAYVSLLGIVLTFAATIGLWNYSHGTGTGMVTADKLALYFNVIFLTAAGLGVLIAIDYIKRTGIERGEYYVLVLFATLGMMFMVAGTNLIIIYLGLETLSLPLYILAAFEQRKLKSIEAGLKYYLLGAFAAAFFLYGLALVYGAVGSTDLAQIAAFVQREDALKNPLLLTGAALLIVGFGYKIAVVPFHTWMPDSYEGAPTSVTAFMSVGAKPGGFSSLARLTILALPLLRTGLQTPLAVIALVTIIIGAVSALPQTNIKRLLGYSGVVHAGFILIGIAAASELGVAAVPFYLLVFTFMNFGAFAVIIALEGDNGENLEIADYAGLARKHPLAGFLLAIFLFSLAGLPPTAGFWAKFYVFNAAVEAGLASLAVWGALGSVIAAAFYLRIVVAIYMREPTSQVVPRFSPPLIAVLVIALLGVIVMGVLPTPLFNFAQQSVAQLVAVLH